MYVLGFNCFKHDAAAVLIHDGRILAAAEEERFNRIKHTYWFPQTAITYCLAEAGITSSDLDAVCFYWRPGKFLFRRVLPTALQCTPILRSLLLREQGKSALYFLTMRKRFFAHFPPHGVRPRFVWVDHHRAHAASACYPSGFSEAAVMVADGAGEHATLSLYSWRGRELTCLRQVNYPHSLGLFYSAITDYLGFRANDDEYKVMGLAAYGRPSYQEQFHRLVWPLADGGFAMDMRFFVYHQAWGGWVSPRFIDAFGPARRPEAELTDFHADIAASAQGVLEEVLLHVAQWLRRTTGCMRLAVAGGVGLNCAANARLLHEAGFAEVFFQPAAADMGAALGACLHYYHATSGAKAATPFSHLFHGPSFSNTDIEAVLLRSKVHYQRVEQLETEVAAHVAAGKIVGWFQGRMEFGPRALGARSILADPRRADMRDQLNRAVKFREEFRPFAPSVTVEDAARFFVIDRPSPYMILIHPVRPEARQRIPAAVHVDGTARVHTVSEETHPRYYRLLRAFQALTGIPVLINTSFNVRGEPIVCTPEDALRTFFTSGLDLLAIGDFLVKK